MNHPSHSLSELQDWMQRAILHNDRIPDSEIETHLLPSLNLSSADRLAIYANAYFARLLECLGEEFVHLQQTIGEEGFRELACGYLREHPSHSYTLAELGSGFPEFLRRTRPPQVSDTPDFFDFLIDLATLERMYAEVFDGPGNETLPPFSLPASLQNDPDAWLETRLIPNPALRLVQLRFPAHEYISEIRRGLSPDPPPPAQTFLVISRREYVVRRVAVEESEFLLLRDLIDGGSIGEVLQLASARSPAPSDLPRQIQQWFAAWTAAGYFTDSTHSSLYLPPPPR